MILNMSENSGETQLKSPRFFSKLHFGRAELQVVGNLKRKACPGSVWEDFRFKEWLSIRCQMFVLEL